MQCSMLGIARQDQQQIGDDFLRIVQVIRLCDVAVSD